MLAHGAGSITHERERPGTPEMEHRRHPGTDPSPVDDHVGDPQGLARPPEVDALHGQLRKGEQLHPAVAGDPAVHDRLVGEPAREPLLVSVEGDPGRHLRQLRHCRVHADVVARRTVPDRQPLVSHPRGADGEWQQVVTAVARVELDEPPRVGGHGRETGIDCRRARFGERAEHLGQLVGSEVERLGEASPVPRPRRRRSLLPAGDGRPLDAQPLGQALLGQPEGLPPGSEALTSGHLVLVGRCLSQDRRSSVGAPSRRAWVASASLLLCRRTARSPFSVPVERVPPSPYRSRSTGGRCEWVYCTKWGPLLVQRTGDRDDVDQMWVCLTHVVHAQVRGWAIVPSGGDG
jgi:hypothetical protein